MSIRRNQNGKIKILVAIIGAVGVIIAALIPLLWNHNNNPPLNIVNQINISLPSTPQPPSLSTSSPTSSMTTAIRMTPTPTTFRTSIPTETPDIVAGMVRAKGLGLPPPTVSDVSQRRRSARLAAITDAKRSLAERIKGVIVESTVTTKSNILTEDTITVRMNTMLKSARIISEKEHEDGSIEVIMEAPLSQ